MSFAAVAGVLAALVFVGGLAAADTQNWDARISSQHRRVVLTLLGEDRSAFAAFSETENFRRVAGLPAANVAIEIKHDPAADDGETREALAALAAEDARAAADVTGARSQAVTDLLVTDFGGVIDLSEIHGVRVGSVCWISDARSGVIRQSASSPSISCTPKNMARLRRKTVSRCPSM